MSTMSITRDLDGFTCDKCNDEVICPNPPMDGVISGVCCTCREVVFSHVYYCFETHQIIDNTPVEVIA